ncbi:uncharacterized protein BDZ99DRAFT_466901 [Mytilinidion resinicola]|uniref:TMEM205-like domain-containing protein n=1 Tax=Mytilinidion resinicola TaxID=574789 RepID=A0A6A6YAX9_9PEZI|nr:uncharacterized protein BDZ99DRAFT_466901 [Mytilinidion resinicola]KAF2805265.1 hypothetical protein BDZ99DRAFT_466901 [Mytilinidion resinicola]
MPTLSTLTTLGPYHFFTYATLLGTSLYQTFVMTKVCYNALPRSAFTTLNKRVFPVYFQGQTLLLALTAATFPPYGPLSLRRSMGDLLPLALAGGMAVLNLVKFGPATQKAMVERGWQETRDGKKASDPDVSDEMRARKKAFSHYHAMSIHLNLVAIGGMVWYGLRLAARLDFG